MKTRLVLFLMAQAICVTLHAQTVNFGPFSGTQGTKSSYFGYNAAKLATAASAENSFFGYNAGLSTVSMYNCGFGTYALTSNSTGSGNTATGYHSLYSNTSAKFNTANGYSSLWANRTGESNTAVGAYSLYANVGGKENTAIGYHALRSNVGGELNTATGTKALFSNDAGFHNTATGVSALEANLGGFWNTAIGGWALASNKSGNQNSASGLSALYHNETGHENTANGWRALYNNKTGKYNSAFGAMAGFNGEGYENTTSLGYAASAMASNSVRIGNSSVISIGGQVMWTTFSDGRFKRNIKEDVSGLDFVNQLRPVSYEVDKLAINRFLNIPDSVTQQLEGAAKKAPVRETGFVAQEVEAIVKKTGYVFNGIEAPQNEHDHYSIRYAAFVVPLVKAVQELTTKLNEQQSKIAALEQKLGLSENRTNGDFNSTTGVALYQNTPNPFSVDTEIKMELPETTRQASVIVYNLEGKELKQIVVSERGNAAVKISANDLSAGMYLYTLIVDGKIVDTKRLILTR